MLQRSRKPLRLLALTRSPLPRRLRVGGRVLCFVSINLTLSESPSPPDCMLLFGLNSDDPCEQGRLIQSYALVQEADISVVRRFGAKLLHELPSAVHPINCLLRVCYNR